MNINIEEYNIYIKPGETDLRKRAETLSFLVRSEMKREPMSKSIFLFCNKSKRRLTAILWNGNGWVEITKKLLCTGGTYCWPKNEKAAEEVNIEEVLEMLRGGNPWRRFPTF